VNQPNQKFEASESPERPKRRLRYRGDHPGCYEERYKELHPDAYPGIVDHVRARGDTPAGMHVPILVKDVLDCLAPCPGDVVVDCTLGFGGHAREFLRRIGTDGLLLGLDADGVQLARTKARMTAEGFGCLRTRHENFTALRGILAAEGIAGVDVIFADLGTSSMQVDDPARGFSYKVDGPLDMRMDGRGKHTAADLVATMSSLELTRALRDLADEPDAEAIAKRIAVVRQQKPICRTEPLVRVVLEAKGLSLHQWRQQLGAGPGALHPAARTFQALRILVNDELSALARLLELAPFCLKQGGRIGILSIHSGEDRLVKGSFRDGLRGGVYDAVCDDVIRPDGQEMRSNPRSSSARFRWARRAREEDLS